MRIYYVFLSLCISCCFALTGNAYAITTKDQQKWQLQQLKRMAESITGLPSDEKGKRLAAQFVKETTVSGTKKTTHAIVETKPTAAKVGGSMLKRIAGSPGGAAIGVYAVTELIEAIGWVMEDGTYVKRIEKEASPTDPQYQYYYTITPRDVPFNAPTARAVYDIYVQWWNNGNYNGWGPITGLRGTEVLANGDVQYDNIYKNYPNWVAKTTIRRVANPNYDPDKEPEDKVVPLTPAMLGAAMLGSGYTDPDPNYDNDIVNTDEWTGVHDAYTPDPSGTGNELADSLEDKAERAKRTTDGKPSQIGDSKYQNPLDDTDDANDRSWDGDAVGEDGSKGESESNTKTDPETGEQTTSSTFKLPAFCDWASVVCEWIDWTQEDLEKDDTENPQVPDDQGIFDRVFNHVFSLPDTCPPDLSFTMLGREWPFSMSWLCMLFKAIGYAMILAANITGLWIFYEIVSRSGVKS